ncbi:hypothetical protein KFK09_027966 [Dendrobium nobile]|uniref:Uncharacterized protein n=1 Tax=Dendrobium nobile TaxID=94219 RepID=A0A8T3A254_DENNO|nr:hypothetical protein KFK09_027966 [Dendrobium nobile]
MLFKMLCIILLRYEENSALGGVGGDVEEEVLEREQNLNRVRRERGWSSGRSQMGGSC